MTVSANSYRSTAANLDRAAGDIIECDATSISPIRTRLPEVLQGAATAHLIEECRECSTDLWSAAEILRRAAAIARQRAADLDTAADLVAAESGAAQEADGESTVVPDLPVS